MERIFLRLRRNARQIFEFQSHRQKLRLQHARQRGIPNGTVQLAAVVPTFDPAHAARDRGFPRDDRCVEMLPEFGELIGGYMKSEYPATGLWAKVVDPSWFNWPALPVAMADTIVPDFPLANKSFNQSYAGNDL